MRLLIGERGIMSGGNRSGKRKRITSELEDVENSPGRSERTENRIKRLRDSPPLTPTLPLSPHNKCDSPESSPKSKPSMDSPISTQRGITSALTWLNRSGMVDIMIERDSQHDLKSSYFSQHANILPQMRSVLLDWICEVCVAYKIHRESYYLAINYFDRYMSKSSHITKNQLQLIGVTCLFIASKVEEIYPPKLHDFAYVTNDACSSEDILSQELEVLNKLEWNLGAITVNGWLSFLLQLWHNRSAPPKSIMFPNHPIKEFLQTIQLLDLCILDEESLQFSYQVLASAAVFITTDFKEVITTPPVEKERRAVTECISWMTPYADVLRERSSPRKTFSDVNYTIQSHSFDLECLEEAQRRSRVLQYSSVVMTPPPSNEKTQTAGGVKN